jgi:hypothetical protein
MIYGIIRSRGDIAQLGERRVRIAEVGGSNPPISTFYFLQKGRNDEGFGYLLVSYREY